MIMEEQQKFSDSKLGVAALGDDVYETPSLKNQKEEEFSMKTIDCIYVNAKTLDRSKAQIEFL